VARDKARRKYRAINEQKEFNVKKRAEIEQKIENKVQIFCKHWWVGCVHLSLTVHQVAINMLISSLR
jgi:hypothetical protein